MRVKKDDYYPCTINIPKKPNKDYEVEVALRKKTKIESTYYTSNETLQLKILSECEI